MRPNCFAAFNSWKTSKNRVFLPFLASTSLWPERLPRGPADNAQRLVSTATQLIRGTPGIPCDRSLVLRGEAAGRAEPPVLRSPPGPRGCPAPRAPRPRFPSHGCEAGGTQALPAIVRTESGRGIPKPHRRPHATLRGDGSRTPKRLPDPAPRPAGSPAPALLLGAELRVQAPGAHPPCGGCDRPQSLALVARADGKEMTKLVKRQGF